MYAGACAMPDATADHENCSYPNALSCKEKPLGYLSLGIQQIAMHLLRRIMLTTLHRAFKIALSFQIG